MNRTKKTCEGCRQSIFVASKTCPHCQHKQPYKRKLSQKREEFEKGQAAWAASVKKNNNCSVVVNRSHLLLDKLAALDYVPVLLLGKIRGKTITADVILPKNNDIERGLVLSIQKAFGSVLKVHSKRKSQSLDGHDQDCSDQDWIIEEGSSSGELNLTGPLDLDITGVEVSLDGITEEECSSGELDLSDGPPAQQPKRGHQRRKLQSDGIIEEGSSSGELDLTGPLDLDLTGVEVSQDGITEEGSSSGELDLPGGPPAQQPKRGHQKRKLQAGTCTECSWRTKHNDFDYTKVLKRRHNEGAEEVLLRWRPCRTCGTKWRDTWEPASFIDT